MVQWSERAFNFPTVHEVVGYGNFSRPASMRTIHIQILLQDLGEDGKNPVTAWAKPVSAWIEGGKLDLVPIGSRWHLGKLVGKPTKQQFFKDKTVYYRGITTLGDGLNVEINQFSEMRCYRLLWKTKNDKNCWIWVPVAELMRALFGVSSRFLVRMFKGVNSPVIAPQSAFYDRDRSSYSEKEKIVKLFCSRPPRDLEIIMAAASLFHPGLKLAHISVSNFVAYKLTQKVGTPFPPEMTFPFENGALDMTFEAQWLVGPAPDPVTPAAPDADHSAESDPPPPGHMLVTHIHSLSFDVDFEHVEIHLNRRKKTEEDPLKLPNTAAYTLATTNKGELQNEDAPTASRVPVEIITDGSRIALKKEVEIIHLPLKESGARSPRLIIDSKTAVLDLSTEDTEPGSYRHAAQAKLRRSSRDLTFEDENSYNDDIDDLLDETRSAIAAAAHKNDWTIISEGNRVLKPTAKRSIFKLMMLELDCGDGRFVLAADAGTNGKALALIIRKDRHMFTSDQKEAIWIVAQDCKGHWGDRAKGTSAFTNLKMEPVHRRPSDKIVDAVKERSHIIETKIRKLLGL